MVAEITTPPVNTTVALTDSEKFDRVEAILSTCPQIEHQMGHTFVPGGYLRTIVMPAGSIYTSKTHRTRHSYVVWSGLVSVRIQEGEWQHIRGPYLGITEPGTRRLLVIHETTTWTCMHETDETDLEKIEADIIEPHDFSKSLTTEELQWLGGILE